MVRRLFKVCSRDEWKQAAIQGVFRGSGIDLQDGFIHLSAEYQLVETVKKHFAGESDLVLVEVDARKLDETLKWEPSRGGDDFPHVYGEIPMDAVLDSQPLTVDASGTHIFPDDLQ